LLFNSPKTYSLEYPEEIRIPYPPAAPPVKKIFPSESKENETFETISGVKIFGSVIISMA
jgi:hypothetical protein